MAKKTREEINALKENWIKDPCWDIYQTEGFEEHYEELLAYQQTIERLSKIEREEKEKSHADMVRAETGIVDAYIVSAISTWNEIERQVSSQDRYIGEIGELADQIKIELMQTQIRATLLQAAQLKRIADALETIAEGNSLEDTVRIWGSGK